MAWSVWSKDLRVRIWQAMCGDGWWDLLEGHVRESRLENLASLAQWLQPAFCWVFGHRPEVDQCMMPEHDYCICCQRLMPFQAARHKAAV